MLREYILAVLESFKNDPADNDYQRGYRDAHQEMLKVLARETPAGKPRLTVVK